MLTYPKCIYIYNSLIERERFALDDRAKGIPGGGRGFIVQTANNLQTCMFRRSTPHQCRLVHIYTCSCTTLIHVNLLSPSACGTRQHNQHMRTCVERHRARVLKRPQGKWALHYSYRHLLRSTRALNNTEVKGHYSTSRTISI